MAYNKPIMRRTLLISWVGAILLFISVTVFLSSSAPWLSDIANTPLLYALAPFVVGALAAARLVTAAGLGIATCTAAVVLFYVIDNAAGPQPMNWSGLVTYGVQALVAGAFFGLLGACLLRLPSRWLRNVAVVGFCTAVLGFQVADVLVEDASSVWDDVTLLANAVLWCTSGSAIGIWASTQAARGSAPSRRQNAWSRTRP